MRRDRLGQHAEQRAVGQCDVGRRHRAGAHHQQLRRIGLLEDGAADVETIDQQRLRRVTTVLLHEGGQRPLSPAAHDRRYVGRHDVHHLDPGIEVAAERGRVGEREFGVRPAADRRQDARQRP